MHVRYFSSLIVFSIFLCACHKDDTSNCNYADAGAGLRFRFVDSAGRDLVYNQTLDKDSLAAWQPCKTDSLVPLFAKYPVPASTDSGYVLHFGNLRTPAYGEAGECYRIFFRWNYDDVDTFDWHYRLEIDNGCQLEIIDYVSYNGVQANFRNDNAYQYYELVK